MSQAIVNIGNTAVAAPLELIDPAQVRKILAHNNNTSLLRFSTAGSVDDGKSTLIGRLLYDSKNIYDDHLGSLEHKAKSSGSLAIDLALLTDGLRAEQEQGITIDVAYRYFSTPKRRFILADSPGHEQYTRNMATGASTADLTIILVDAAQGIMAQTKRHAFIASLLGVPRLLVAINKMDLVDFDERIFDLIKRDFGDFAVRLGVKEIKFIPISALHGDNVVARSTRMPWYHGESVLEHLEDVYVAADQNQVDFRFPVQHVIRCGDSYRGYAGLVRSGSIKVGDQVVALPSLQRTRIKSIDLPSIVASPKSVDTAHAGMSVSLTLTDQLDISRGDMLVRPKNLPHVQRSFEAMIVWMHEQPLDPTRQYLVMHTTRTSKVLVDSIEYKVDVNTLSRLASPSLGLNEIGRVSFTAKQPLFLDPYTKNRTTGSFVLVDEESCLTVAAGMVIDRAPAPADSAEVESQTSARPRSENIHAELGLVTRALREAFFGARAHTIWLTGLSGSGKSTVAKGLEQRLFGAGKPVYRLDGDNLRGGLNSNLGFSKGDRSENIRRAAEVAKLFNDAGISVVCSLISPLAEDRAAARAIIGDQSFIEVYLNTPLQVCEQRDPHGLYKKARAGVIKEFTGISAPYEAPQSPELSVDTSQTNLEQTLDLILAQLAQ